MVGRWRTLTPKLTLAFEPALLILVGVNAKSGTSNQAAAQHTIFPLFTERLQCVANTEPTLPVFDQATKRAPST